LEQNAITVFNKRKARDDDATPHHSTIKQRTLYGNSIAAGSQLMNEAIDS